MNKTTKLTDSGTERCGFLLLLSFVLVLCVLPVKEGISAPVGATPPAKAQAGKEYRITGSVVDPTGLPIIGANVIVQGTTIGTTTDVKGAFTLDVPPKGAIQVSYLGYRTQTIALTGQTQYIVTLHENPTTLQDVVVVGYGVQRKESVVGAISQVKGDALVDAGVSNITNALAGKLSGVTTIQTSGQPGQNDAEILIRGVSSFSNSNPLVLVDGVERDFSTIDPQEVANISVLKDASATAVFGAKGANGVIIVTTKSGQEGKPKMDFSFSTGFAVPINTPEHIDSYRTMSLMNVAKMNDQQILLLALGSILQHVDLFDGHVADSDHLPRIRHFGRFRGCIRVVTHGPRHLRSIAHLSGLAPLNTGHVADVGQGLHREFLIVARKPQRIMSLDVEIGSVVDRIKITFEVGVFREYLLFIESGIRRLIQILLQARRHPDCHKEHRRSDKQMLQYLFSGFHCHLGFRIRTKPEDPV